MKAKLIVSVFSFFIGFMGISQCGSTDACNPNTGIFSNSNATEIAYDNMGSSFHSSFIKEPNGSWKVWGEHMMNDGQSNALTPQSFDATHYPNLTGSILCMGLGSDFGLQVQLLVLTTDGIFVLGDPFSVLDSSLTSGSSFQKLVVDGEQDGLPHGIDPQQVKMFFVTTGAVAITTCAGDVYVLSFNEATRGDGGLGNSQTWSRVMQNETTPLTNVIVTRGSGGTLFALKSDGTLWTWGLATFLGNGTSFVERNFATQMITPTGIPGIKMIQATNSMLSSNISYYVVSTDNRLFSLGFNEYGQLGDNTSTNRQVWVNAKNPNNTIITDAAWISANEHDYNLPGVALIKTNGIAYTCGSNSYYMIGRTNGGDSIFGDINYFNIPTGITASDFITFAETGGHTCALIKKCSSQYGYVGHRIRGSMGDGSSVDQTTSSYDFVTPPAIQVCGAQYNQPIILTSNDLICAGESAVFTISGSPGDTIVYNLNNGTSQMIQLDASGSYVFTITNVQVNQTLHLTQITDFTAQCVYTLSLSKTVSLYEQVPVFNPFPPICVGQNLNPLPVLSNNHIPGTWSPPVNNQQTTTYTFTPSNNCSVPVQVTIAVQTPLTPEFNAVPSICQGDFLSPLPTTSINGVVGTWSPAINNQQTTTYFFTPSANCHASVSLTIQVTPRVTPLFEPIPSICEGSQFPELLTVSQNAITGVWSPNPNSTATTTYTFTPDANQCANPTTLTVVVIPKVTPLFNAVETLCYGTPFVLPDTSLNAVDGSWSPIENPTATTTYTFTPAPSECAFPTTLTVEVYDDFGFAVNQNCSEGHYIVTLVPAVGFNTAAASVEWFFEDEVIGNGLVLDVTQFLNSIGGNLPFPLVFSVTLTDENQCSKSQIVQVLNPVCSIPNVITPNDDGSNDYLNLGNFDVRQIYIYNRWGVEVYSKGDYINEWKGQNNAGSLLPVGVYFYVIDFRSETQKTGWIQLLRDN